MRLYFRIPLTFLFFSCLTPLFPQFAGEEQQLYAAPEAGEPFWLLLERGKREMARGELGTALYLFHRALDEKPIFPEAEMAIGDVFLAEGEAKLAQKQYEKARDEQKAFLVAEDRYTVLYKIADMYRLAGRYADWKAALEAVIREDEDYFHDTFERLGEHILNKYREQGLDRVLELYRFERKPAARAHRELAELHYKVGEENSTALLHRLFAVVIVLSDAIAEYRIVDPLYQFSSLAEFLDLAEGRPSIVDYFDETALYEQLYYLGVSSYAAGNEERGRRIWELLESADGAGRYADLAARQIRSPWVDRPSIEL